MTEDPSSIFHDLTAAGDVSCNGHSSSVSRTNALAFMLTDVLEVAGSVEYFRERFDQLAVAGTLPERNIALFRIIIRAALDPLALPHVNEVITKLAQVHGDEPSVRKFFTKIAAAPSDRSLTLELLTKPPLMETFVLMSTEGHLSRLAHIAIPLLPMLIKASQTIIGSLSAEQRSKLATDGSRFKRLMSVFLELTSITRQHSGRREAMDDILDQLFTPELFTDPVSAKSKFWAVAMETTDDDITIVRLLEIFATQKGAPAICKCPNLLVEMKRSVPVFSALEEELPETAAIIKAGIPAGTLAKLEAKIQEGLKVFNRQGLVVEKGFRIAAFVLAWASSLTENHHPSNLAFVTLLFGAAKPRPDQVESLTARLEAEAIELLKLPPYISARRASTFFQILVELERRRAQMK